MSEFNWTERDQLAVEVGRGLTADAVQNVGNGHPGTAISLSGVAYTLFQKVMNFDPNDDQWLGRDRFVLSAGHSSLTLYNQLFLAGAGLELDDLKGLRQWGSLTPGHPEYGHTRGVETTTGPLGQGISNAVGMAMATRRIHGLLDPNTPLGDSPFDHYTFVIAGEGDLEEGVASEASSIAGTQKLGNLVVLYDENDITIEDNTSIAYTEDALARYAAYGWHTQTVDFRNNGNYHENLQAVFDAIEEAKKVTDRPSIIKLKTIIAWPSPNIQNSAGAHGNALGDEEIRGLKEKIGLNPDLTFQVPDGLLEYTRGQVAARAAAAHEVWDAKFEAWKNTNPEKFALYQRLLTRSLPEGWEKALPVFEPGQKIATRAASGKVLNALKDVLPELWGGSADLAGSNSTTMDGEPSFIPSERSSKKFPGNEFGRTLHFGIREHAMGSILNGITLEGLTRVYGGTFLVFADYMRPPVRLAALMKIPSIFVWTHDSVGVGEDGPTHQPVEHMWSYRAIPGLDMVRPADANETAWAWRGILENTSNPAGLVLTRQGVPVFERGEGQAHGDVLASAEGTLKGGYVLADADKLDVVLIATGSEVQLALEARAKLAQDGIGARVVSMPSVEWFNRQDAAYRESVIPTSVRARVSVEAGVTFGWASIVGDAGRSVGIDNFGASADGALLMEKFGMTAEHVVEAAKESIAAAK
ncbi:transketolase [Arcanobacterium wilhelmae]|uniref:Transketolase n=1 Tax=Arcanobacterium wilhelmae TaxID=1803177 RepID=A0ABT9N8G2_9ACTO|nr:transketolase [Arcanobacterium wilhelmae]MDP9799997.1 transketolase [Arcanobacterium wilhelmae]